MYMYAIINILIVAQFSSFLVCAIKYFKSDKKFFIFYVIVVLYNLLPQVALTQFTNEFLYHGHIQVNITTVLKFVISFTIINLTLPFWYKLIVKKQRKKLYISVIKSKYLHIITLIFAVCILVYFVTIAHDLGGYTNQTIMKSNPWLMHLYYLITPVFMYLLYKFDNNSLAKFIVITIVFFSFIYFSIQTGDRTAIFTIFCSLFFLKLTSNKKLGELKLILTLFSIFMLLVILQVLRRSDISSIDDVISSLTNIDYKNDYLFSFTGLFFQDYTGPSFLYLYDIEFDYLDKFNMLKEVLFGAIPFIPGSGSGYYAASPILHLYPNATGLGYYFLNDVLIISPFILGSILSAYLAVILYKLFFNTLSFRNKIQDRYFQAALVGVFF